MGCISFRSVRRRRGEDGAGPWLAPQWIAKLGRSAMSEERKKVLQRFEDRLARLEALRHEMPARWQIFHLHNALNALPDDHDTAHLHLDEFDRHELAKEYPELEAHREQAVARITSRFDP